MFKIISAYIISLNLIKRYYYAPPEETETQSLKNILPSYPGR